MAPFSIRIRAMVCIKPTRVPPPVVASDKTSPALDWPTRDHGGQTLAAEQLGSFKVVVGHGAHEGSASRSDDGAGLDASLVEGEE